MYKLPIKMLILIHPDMPKSQGILLEELDSESFNNLKKEYGEEYPKGIPEVWTRDGKGFQVLPTPKDSDEFENSGYELAIVRETKN